MLDSRRTARGGPLTRHIPIQLGMLGVSSVVEEHHVVAAHTRVNADGTETFVPEHVRRNSGRRTGARPNMTLGRQGDQVPDDHPCLFDAPAAPHRRVGAPSLHLAVQLPLSLQRR